MTTLLDVITAEDTGSVCDFCGDIIERGETVAVLAGGARVHEDGCYEARVTEDEFEETQ